MTVKQRILAIRIAENVDKNKDYAQQIGVSAKMKVLPPATCKTNMQTKNCKTN